MFTSKSFPTKFFQQINNSNFQLDVDFRSTFNRTPPKSPTLIKKKKRKNRKDRHIEIVKRKVKKKKRNATLRSLVYTPFFKTGSAIVRAFNPVIMRGIREIRRRVSGSSSFTGLSWISTTFLEGTIFRRSRGIEPSK